jgi:hypothetical protein
MMFRLRREYNSFMVSSHRQCYIPLATPTRGVNKRKSVLIQHTWNQLPTAGVDLPTNHPRTFETYADQHIELNLLLPMNYTQLQKQQQSVLRVCWENPGGAADAKPTAISSTSASG